MKSNQAIRHATATVRMYPFGQGHVVETYCHSRWAWISGPQMPFYVARARLTEKRHAAALVELGWTQWDADCEACDGTGPLRDRVNASLEKWKEKTHDT